MRYLLAPLYNKRRATSCAAAFFGAILCAAMLSGCAGRKTVAAALPTNAINTADADSYRVLADARAALLSIHDSVQSGSLTLTAAQKDLYNQMQADLNTAMHAWQLAHAAGTGNSAALTTAVATLTADLARLSGLFKKTN